MARLGKRERARKAALIAHNLANPPERARSVDWRSGAVVTRDLGSSLNVQSIKARTHTGASVGWNIKGSEDGTRRGGKVKAYTPEQKAAKVERALASDAKRHDTLVAYMKKEGSRSF